MLLDYCVRTTVLFGYSEYRTVGLLDEVCECLWTKLRVPLFCMQSSSNTGLSVRVLSDYIDYEYNNGVFEPISLVVYQYRWTLVTFERQRR